MIIAAVVERSCGVHSCCPMPLPLLANDLISQSIMGAVDIPFCDSRGEK